MKGEYKKSGIVILLVTFLILICWGNSGMCAEGVIKIGMAQGLTGPNPAHLDTFKSRMDMIAMINESGGIRGHRVEALWADSKYQLPPEISAYKRFVDQGAVGFFSASSSGTEQLKILGQTYGIPTVFPCNTMIVRDPPGWSFPVIMTYGDCTAGLMDWILKNMWKKAEPPKVAVITNETGYGRAVEEALPYMENKGVKLVYTAYISMTAVDVTPQLLQAEKAGADFIITNPAAEGSALVRDFKRLDLHKKGKYIISPWSIALPAMAPGSAEMGSGFILGTFQFLIPDFEGQHGLPEMRRLKDFQMKKYGHLMPTGLYWVSVPEVFMMAEAIGKAIDEVGYEKLTGKDVYTKLEEQTVPSEKVFHVTPDLVAKPGKRGTTDKAVIAIAHEGKWKALSGWEKMPNLKEWKDSHPEYYKK
jgi:hypothetical protein